MEWRMLFGMVLLAGVLSIQACCDIPPYNPAFWNDANGVQYHNNCYNYGNNKETGTYAQPGRASGITLTSANMNCADVTNGAVADGIEQSNAVDPCLDDKDKIALVIAPGWDYHWYRLDDNGRWSHKPGGTQATNLDNSGNLILSPETADRGIYTNFCGYFCSCSDDAQGNGHEDIQ